LRKKEKVITTTKKNNNKNNNLQQPQELKTIKAAPNRIDCNHITMKSLQVFILFFAAAMTTVASAFCPSHYAFGNRKQQQLSSRRSVVGKDHFDMEELRERLESNPYQDLFQTKEWEERSKPDVVNIILFKPDTSEEGVHTVEFPKGSGNNVILAFESMKECGAFAAMLKAQHFFDPAVRDYYVENEK
jgi:hypothetical protein